MFISFKQLNMKASFRAKANIALIKYWGKSNKNLNLPSTGSISITLDSLYSDTEIIFTDGLDRDYSVSYTHLTLPTKA